MSWRRGNLLLLGVLCVLACVSLITANITNLSQKDFLVNAAQQLVENNPQLFAGENLLDKIDALSEEWLDDIYPEPNLSQSTREWINKKNKDLREHGLQPDLSVLKPIKLPAHMRVGQKKTTTVPHVQQPQRNTYSSNIVESVVASTLFNATTQPEEAVLSYAAGVLPGTLKSQAYCANVFVQNYNVYPQRVNIDIDTISISFQDLECDRHIERDTLVSLIPVVAGLISDDTLRHDWAKLTCSWFYRPLFNPTKLPCLQQCVGLRDYITNLDTNTATPAQLRDKAVLETFAWPQLLIGGQCEYTDFYDHSNDPVKCTHSDDPSVFKPMSTANIKRPQCTEYTGQLCSGMLTHYYNDPSNVLLNEIDKNEEFLRAIYRLAPKDTCLNNLAQFICSRFVMSCTEVPVTLTDLQGNLHVVKYALPVLTNKQVCDNYATHCSRFLTALSNTATEFSKTLPPSMASIVSGTLLSFLSPECTSPAPIGAQFECDNKSYVSMYRYFPDATYYKMDLGVTTATIKTQKFDYDTQYDQATLLPFTPPVDCPAPLVVFNAAVNDPSSQLNGGSCAQPCPSFLFSEDDYKSSSIIAVVLCTLSIFASLFLIVSYLCFKEIRQGNYFLQFLLCIVVITFAFAIGAYLRFDPSRSIQSHYCKNSTDIGQQRDNPGCTVQAFCIQFALLALAAFFASSGFDLFLKVVLSVEIRPNTQYDYLLNLAYYFWGWTIPLLLTTIAAATNSLGPADLGMFFCFVHGRNNGTVPWATAYLPFMIQLFIGCISLSTTILQLVRLAKRQQQEEYERQTRDLNYRVNQAPTLRLANYLVPLMLECVFFVYLMFIVLFRAAVFFSETNWQQKASKFVTCLLVVNPITVRLHKEITAIPITYCGDKPETIKMGVWFFYQALLAFVGLAVFAILGTQKIYYQLWAAVIGYYFNIPGLLVWAATTNQAKLYAKRLARAHRQKQKKLAEEGQKVSQENDEDQEIVNQVKKQAEMIKNEERAALEQKQQKERDRQEQQKTANLNMIAPHLRPLYMVQQRPRKVLPSLVEIVGNPDATWGPKPCNVPDIFELFNIQLDTPNPRRGRGGGDGSDMYDMDYNDTSHY